MSPELEQAIRERLELGHSKDQITAELRAAGYDEATIEHVYNTVAGNAAASPIPPAGSGALIGYGELVSASFRLLQEQWKLFLVSSLYGLGWVALLFVFMFTAVSMSETSMAVAITLGIGGFVIGVIGIMAISFGFQRALLERRNEQPFLTHIQWAVHNLIGLILVTLYVQFATSLGYLLLVVPGIALAIYLSYAMLTRIAGEETGVMALVRSTELVYGRWWGVLGRVIFVTLVFVLCLLPLFFLVFVVLGGVNLMGGVGGTQFLGVPTSSFNEMLIPLLAALLFVFSIITVAFLVQCSMVLLYESLRATATTFTEAGRAKLYKWMRIAVIVGVIPTILFNGLDLYLEADRDTNDFESFFGPALELDEEIQLTPEQQAEFEAFMEQFGEELKSGN